MERLISFCGLFVMIGLAWLMSSHKRKIQFRVIIGGLLLQFFFAVLILKTTPGAVIFKGIGDFFTTVIRSADAGSLFMFEANAEIEVPVLLDGVKCDFRGIRDNLDKPIRDVVARLKGREGTVQITVGDATREFDLDDASWEKEVSYAIATEVEAFREKNFPRTRQLLTSFAFGVLPTIIFFSALMTVLYYLGVMQRVVAFFAWIMQRTLGTSGAESLSAAANIFVGQTEAPLAIRPYVGRMTMSELNAVMVGGFATIAGGVLAAYVQMGIPAGHLVTASFISAPAALLIAKVMQPETEHSMTMGHVELEVEEKDANLIEAAAKGAADGLKLALNVGAMLIAFLAFIALFNTALGAMGGYINSLWGQQWEWSLERGLSYLFWPLAWIMGIPKNECFLAGELLGIKMVANEFIAYDKLSRWIDTGAASPLSERSVRILTYALCGFANFGSIGIQLGGIGVIAPQRRGDLARLGLRAMIGGTLAAFMTACVAGVLV
ncbi:MAG: hypothetical protein GTO53_02560 [Planctomycetales bacterium]|nr:hypothetical protein [Planctomycetales bacterium]NIM08051.1 hypothetical protein [Planctomycetales bacterium]NIN07542.1 hypothetical protein [Planctomycetales bacterium]NIN76649.1 hypothetical protein [Planctomycetales bacterium]NIO33837.1 hypothetical protein [Planctomycetales bacterium]